MVGHFHEVPSAFTMTPTHDFHRGPWKMLGPGSAEGDDGRSGVPDVRH